MNKTLVVCHDAGGSEVISSYLKQQGYAECVFVLAGPALKIFHSKLGQIKQISLQEGLRQAKRLICGTSWQSDLEHEALMHAKERGLYTMVFLEHWGTYRDRFLYQGKEWLPDEIIVGDEEAERQALEYFVSSQVRRIDNPYLKELKDAFKACQYQPLMAYDEVRVLYVCAPIREPCQIQYGDPFYLGYSEEDALKYFLDNYQSLQKAISSITIRSHPSETEDKYRWAIEEYPHLPITIGQATLAEEVANSDVVIGCETMAMVVALLAEKHVFSSIPPGHRPCQLPQKEIIPLSHLISPS